MAKTNNRSFQLDRFGELKMNCDDNGFFWFGDVKNIAKDSPVELTIEVDDDNEPTQGQIELIKEFVRNRKFIEGTIFQYLEDSFLGSKWEKNKEELSRMYYLSAVNLKRNKDWWVVLEPEINVHSIFNFFPRFTIKDYKIEWSNVK